MPLYNTVCCGFVPQVTLKAAFAVDPVPWFKHYAQNAPPHVEITKIFLKLMFFTNHHHAAVLFCGCAITSVSSTPCCNLLFFTNHHHTAVLFCGCAITSVFSTPCCNLFVNFVKRNQSRLNWHCCSGEMWFTICKHQCVQCLPNGSGKKSFRAQTALCSNPSWPATTSPPQACCWRTLEFFGILHLFCNIMTARQQLPHVPDWLPRLANTNIPECFIKQPKISLCNLPVSQDVCNTKWIDLLGCAARNEQKVTNSVLPFCFTGDQSATMAKTFSSRSNPA